MKHPFFAGALLYPAIELAWRGRTHPAMALAGGLAMTGLAKIQKTNRPFLQRVLLGGLMITGIEYAFGRLFNRRYQIWDYRRMPFHVQGQICLPYTAAWCALSAAAFGLLGHSSRERMSAMRRLALPSP